jgi:hypothetical protein
MSACSPGLNQRLQTSAGERIGAAEVAIVLAPQPAQCALDTPHAPIEVGMEVRSILIRERAQLDQANAEKRDCFAFNEELRTNLAQPLGD